ncbi:DUF3889 domain-containing protein [Neobacillus sp. DY30]|uniref:DUF3889 domain-containing protein n=1 Tax=Neobacillus sp. DY30 TaxID=3047871 RepID=UPI0024BF423D|nr:DUF3889 domain-containing protein [Neobacillus sp. DY30]WHY00456.1 DUF3889 domain-containing protein [Neobacillus sp. DY30]
MKKLLICFLLLFGFTCSSLPQLGHTAYAQQKPIPPYAKWSKIALAKTKEKYPNAQIIDYLYVGRQNGTRTSTEKFKLWLKENGKEFGVYVDIEFIKETEQVVNITYTETAR